MTDYTEHEIREWLKNYQRYAHGCRPPKREEVLVQRAAPEHEAASSSSSRRRADIERALQHVPFMHQQVTIDVLVKGHSTWNRGTMHAWKQKIADWYGIEQSEVNRYVDQGLRMMCDWLNGVASMVER